MRAAVIGLGILGVAVAGCSSDTIGGVAFGSEETVQKTPTTFLSEAYGYTAHYMGNKERLRAELVRRQAFTTDQWARIDERTVAVGDPVELVFASWGTPDRVRNAVDATGSYQLFIYEHDYSCSYVHLREGRVLAVEN